MSIYSAVKDFFDAFYNDNSQNTNSQNFDSKIDDAFKKVDENLTFHSEFEDIARDYLKKKQHKKTSKSSNKDHSVTVEDFSIESIDGVDITIEDVSLDEDDHVL